MLQRLFSSFFIIFIFVSNTILTSVPPFKQEEQLFLSLMDAQLGAIINNCKELKGKYHEVKPLLDGGASFINSVYLITTEEGEELIIKIGNPIWKGYKTLNEVSALKFLKHNSTIPVPKVLFFENNAETSLIGAEYIIMPRINGKPLSAEINRLYEDKNKYHKVLDQLASVIAELKMHQFSNIGNFITSDEDSNKLKIGGIVDFAGYEIDNPCSCFSDYAKHALSYYVREMETLIKNDSQERGIYAHFIPLLRNLMKTPDFQYLNLENDKFVFSHQDFVMKNILIQDDEVTAILDWEWSGSALSEIEPMTGFDFLLSDEDRAYFDEKLKALGVDNFFAKPNNTRQLFYRLIGDVYSLVAFREWREGKLEHTAKFLSQKLEQRKIRNNDSFDSEAFLNEVSQDLTKCISIFMKTNV